MSYHLPIKTNCNSVLKRMLVGHLQSLCYIIIIIIEFNSGTIKIELDNTMWTVQPEQGRKG